MLRPSTGGSGGTFEGARTMRWTGDPSRGDETGRYAAAQAAAAAESDLQNRRAARVVAGRAFDAADCAEMLAMLGLDARPEPDRH
jgi:hypothetical protein